MGMELQLNQTQTLSPQVIQNLEILQMNSTELAEYVSELVQENPVLELGGGTDRPGEDPDPRSARAEQSLQWQARNDRQNQWYVRSDAASADERRFQSRQTGEESLADHIRAQLTLDDPPLEQAVDLLLESLDGNGWLEDSLEELSAARHIPIAVLERALALIQTAEPAGVGARDLRECLLLQLRRQPEPDGLTVRIVQDFLPELAKSHYNGIAKALKVNQAAVRAALERIRALNPRPGNGFSGSHQTQYVSPDVIAVPIRGKYELLLNDTRIPKLNLSLYYTQLLSTSTDEEVTGYLSDKVRQAKWAVSAIEQRRDTILRCMTAIIELQADSFYHGGGIRPRRLADVAERLGVHESTVSRAIRGKWLQCPEGIVPMSKFFSQEVSAPSGGGISAVEAKRRLKALIQSENTAAPLSDQRLCELLANDGCVLSRRTVAKYRSEMGFPPATGRKRR